MCEIFPLIQVIGIIIVSPLTLLGYIFAWTTIAIIGCVIFIGFSISAIFLDTINWMHISYNRGNTSELTKRLKKASKIMINIFMTMAELKYENINEQLV